MKIVGETMIFTNEYNGKVQYSTTVSKKNENGEYENMFISVQLKGALPNKTKINIKDSFLSFYNTKEGLPKVKIVIMEYDVKLSQVNGSKYDYADVTITEDELPF